jgi:hypothetical protein
VPACLTHGVTKMLKKITAALILIGLINLGLILCNQPQDKIYDEITLLQDSGKFKEAEDLIHNYMQGRLTLNAETRGKLEFEIERGKRIIKDYDLKEEDLYTTLEQRMTGLTREEFNHWQQEGRFDWLLIDGEKRFLGASASNLFFRYPELNQRRRNYNPLSTTARYCLAQVKELQQLSTTCPDAVLLPRRCLVEQKIIIPKDKVPAGEKVCCWLPYPTVFELQGDIQFKSSSYPPAWLAPAGSPIRCVYFETLADGNDLTFTVSYYYTAYASFRVIDADKVIPFSGREPEYITYTRQESPHELFTERLKNLCAAIVGTETNPYLKGKKIYNWIADSIKYSYAREYSTIRNISAYCLEKKYGDCGQEGMLFITLCRIAGIPARWQSGFMVYPGDEGMHDWTEIYIKPYGWLPVDPYMGIFFTSVTADLTPSERQEVRAFYYGNMDNYRLVINKGHNLELYPAKKYFRSETVDFQRGEVEWSGGNLYFPDWKWSITLTEMANPRNPL